MFQDTPSSPCPARITLAVIVDWVMAGGSVAQAEHDSDGQGRSTGDDQAGKLPSNMLAVRLSRVFGISRAAIASGSNDLSPLRPIAIAASTR